MTSTNTRGSRGGIGSHTIPNNGETNEWYTPPGIFAALGLDFDLDPCAPPGGLPWIPAARSLSIADDGLTAPWEGRVWMNPPYGQLTQLWMRRLAAHGDGVALAFARTDTEWFQKTIGAAAAVCFIAGRLTFIAGDGRSATSNAGGPSCLIAYGDACADAVARCGLGVVFSVRGDPLLGQGSLWEAPL